MRRSILTLAIAIAAATVLTVLPAHAQTAGAAMTYPDARRTDLTETLHGTALADPYRWLENDVRTDAEVAAWVEAENAVTQAHLATLPGRAHIEARLKALWDYDKFGVPDAHGGRYFYRRQTGLQNQASLYVQDGLDAEPRLLLDPSSWAADGATALGEVVVSKDGERLAYTIQDGGTDWRIIKVMDVDTGQTLPDELRWSKFATPVWAPDGQSLFYARYPEPPAGQAYTALNYDMAVYRHRIGDPQSADQRVYSRPDNPTHGFGFETTDDGKHLVVTVWIGTDAKYEIVLIDLADASVQPRLLISGFDADYSLVGKDDAGRLLFRTDRDAPNGRIVAIDPARPQPADWQEIVPQQASVLNGADRIGDVLVAGYLVDARSEVRRYALDGAPLGTVALPGLGSASGFSGEAGDPETFYSFTSYDRPATVYRYDAATNESTVFKAPRLPFDPNDYAVEQVFYASKDGTRVPMFVIHRKDVTPNGARPTLLYGYGGFNSSETPGFSVSRLQWMEMGGVMAVANIRGGGEYGKTWHDGGRLLNKQNVFDDFIAAGEFLVSSGWTSPAHLGVQGGSNGGLLVGAVVNQRPDLFAAALPAVGVMDMLRYNQFSAGRFWTDDYGDPADEVQFRNLLTYSPYHNIRRGAAYPAILATTADTDDRVVPGHTFKYVAELQAAQGGAWGGEAGPPRLVRIETRAGHGSGKPTDKVIAEAADRWVFLAHYLGLTVPE